MRDRIAVVALLLAACFALLMPSASAQSPLRELTAGKLTGHCGPGRRAIGRLCVNVGPTTACPPGRVRLKGHCTKPLDGIANPGSISLPCAKGQKRRGKRCVDVGTPQICPPGRVRVRGDCIKSPIDVADPGGIARPCPKDHKRIGKRCIEIGTPCPSGKVLYRGRCDNISTPPPVVTLPEGKCRESYERRGKRCVAVLPPSSPPPSGPPVVPPKATTPLPAIPQSILALTANRPHRPREVLVLLSTADAPAATTELMRRRSLVAVDSSPVALIDATLVRFSIVDNRPLEQVLAALAGDSSVLAAQPNYRFEVSDELAGGAKRYPQYAPAKMRIPEAHAIAKGRGVKLAIIDTGIDERHPEIMGAVADRFDSLREGELRAESHGTAVAGLISARINLRGIAPEARVLSVRAFASNKGGTAQSTSLALVRGIDWAFAAEARLFNLSFAGPHDELLGKVIAAAAKKGAIFVAAAGNGGPDAAPAYPGAFPDVIAVTATDDREQVFSRAQRGAYVAIAAPGVDILTPAPGATYDISSGTSIAAAHVTGIVALILQRDPSASPEAVRAILRTAARRSDVLDTQRIGAGHVDARRALEKLEARAELD